VDDFCKEHLND